MAGDKGRRPLWHWLLIFSLIEVFGAFFLVPGATLERLHAQEMGMLEAQLGEEASELMQGWAEKWFQTAFVDTGLVAACERFFKRSDNPRDPFDDRGLGALMHKRTEVLWLAVRYGLYRWGMLLLWLPLVVAAVLPVSLDAAYQRDIRKYQFSHTSGLKHNNSLWVLKVVILLVFFMPLLPVAVPPLAIPAVMMLGMVAWWVYWANMQKRL